MGTLWNEAEVANSNNKVNEIPVKVRIWNLRGDFELNNWNDNASRSPDQIFRIIKWRWSPTSSSFSSLIFLFAPPISLLPFPIKRKFYFIQALNQNLEKFNFKKSLFDLWNQILLILHLFWWGTSSWKKKKGTAKGKEGKEREGKEKEHKMGW